MKVLQILLVVSSCICEPTCSTGTSVLVSIVRMRVPPQSIFLENNAINETLISHNIGVDIRIKF